MDEHLVIVLEQLKKKGFDLDVVKDLKSGKEADVYVVRGGEEVYALKVYTDIARASFGRIAPYMAGKNVSRQYHRAVRAKNRSGLEFVQAARTKREFKILERLHKQGASVPNVFAHTDRAVLMQFFGDKDLNPAPRLNEIHFTKEEAHPVFDQVIRSMGIFLENAIIHGDLSPFNILWHEGQHFVIDFPQAISATGNPNASEMLARDLKHVIRYFEKFIDIPSYEIMKNFEEQLKLM